MTVEAIGKHESLPRAAELTRPEIQAEIVRAVKEKLGPTQMALAVGASDASGAIAPAPPDIKAVVKTATELFIERGSMDVPRIIVTPMGEVSTGFEDFDLDTSQIHYQPVVQNILIHHLQSNDRERLRGGAAQQKPLRQEDYLVHLLVDYDDICYDEQADLLYKLAGQAVSWLHSYLNDKEKVENVLQYYRQQLAALIHAQMQQHRWEKAAGYEAHVSKGFLTLREAPGAIHIGGIRNFRETLEDRQEIRNLLFDGFRRCLYSAQKFDSDTERRFAILLEDDPDVVKWVKPPRGQFHIYYRNDQKYEPDFIVETRRAKYLCEPKRASEMETQEVQDKARAAVVWCQQATEHARKYSDKSWSYLLIPHDAINANKSLEGLAANFRKQ
ncbi:MAG: hypothetical protein ACREEM_18925 [Blastocatellia bacterium]